MLHPIAAVLSVLSEEKTISKGISIILVSFLKNKNLHVVKLNNFKRYLLTSHFPFISDYFYLIQNICYVQCWNPHYDGRTDGWIKLAIETAPLFEDKKKPHTHA